VISHAEAIDRIGDAATERHGIERLMGDPSSDPELRAHIASCDACQSEVRAWQQTAAALLLAAPVSGAAAGDAIAGRVIADRTIDNRAITDDAVEGDELSVPPLSGETRERVLATVRSSGIPRGDAPAATPPMMPLPVLASSAPLSPMAPVATTAAPLTMAVSPASKAQSGRRPVRFRWLALAAAAVLVIFVAGALLGAPLGLVHSDQMASELRSALAASGRILEQPTHRQAALVDTDGTPVGAVVVDGQNGDIVVLSNGGDDQGGNAEYHCYLVRGDSPRTWLGAMVAQAGTSFWVGHVDKVTDLGRPGDVIEVVDKGTSPEFTATF
jgi:hypothetical protein